MSSLVARGGRRWPIETKEFFNQIWHDQTVNKALGHKIEGLGIRCFAVIRELSAIDLFRRLCHRQLSPVAYLSGGDFTPANCAGGHSSSMRRGLTFIKLGASREPSHRRIGRGCADSAHCSGAVNPGQTSTWDSRDEHTPSAVVSAESGTRSGFYRRPAARRDSAFPVPRQNKLFAKSTKTFFWVPP